ncbi:hypothetical protein RMATCC62417_13773 [Rhizopus microsporus]|nr:hypothetical protein RMATCC62417_13773 [Rhizopus microsporus]
MVGRMSNEQEHPIDSYDLDTSTDNTRRYYQHRLWSEVGNTRDVGLLARGRKRDFYQCKGTEDDLLCIEISRIKRQKLDHPTVLRQPNCPQICNEDRRDSVVLPPDTSAPNLGNYERIQSDSEGRSLYTNGSSQENVQDNRAPLAETDDRHLCYPPKLPGKSFLKLITRSRSSSHRFIHSSLAKKGTISSSALEVDPENNVGFQRTKQYYAAVDTTVLVSFDLTDGALAAKYGAHEQVLDVDRWKAIQQGHVGMAIDLGTSSFLNQRIRKRTSQAYNHGWQKWIRWHVSQELKVDSLAYDPKNILRFFMDHQSYPIQQLKVYQATIASVFRILYPNIPSIASNIIIQDLLQTKLKAVVKLSKQAQIETWVLSILTKYIATNFGNSISLTIDKLQQKTILLLCTVKMWRSSSDIAALQTRDVHFKFDNDAISLVLHRSSVSKKAQGKHSILAILFQKSMCRLSFRFPSLLILLTLIEKCIHTIPTLK